MRARAGVWVIDQRADVDSANSPLVNRLYPVPGGTQSTEKLEIPQDPCSWPATPLSCDSAPRVGNVWVNLWEWISGVGTRSSKTLAKLDAPGPSRDRAPYPPPHRRLDLPGCRCRYRSGPALSSKRSHSHDISRSGAEIGGALGKKSRKNMLKSVNSNCRLQRQGS